MTTAYSTHGEKDSVFYNGLTVEQAQALAHWVENQDYLTIELSTGMHSVHCEPLWDNFAADDWRDFKGAMHTEWVRVLREVSPEGADGITLEQRYEWILGHTGGGMEFEENRVSSVWHMTCWLCASESPTGVAGKHFAHGPSRDACIAAFMLGKAQRCE